MAQWYKNLPTVQKRQEMWVQSLGREDALGEGMSTTPVFLPGEFHEKRSLVSSSPWGRKESDRLTD